MRIKILPALISLFIINNINAQPDFKPGYVILNVNDTIFGEIDSRGYQAMGQIFDSDQTILIRFSILTQLILLNIVLLMVNVMCQKL